MKSIVLSLLSLAALALTGRAETMTFDFKDPKGVNNIVFKLDAPLESINGTANGITGTITADPANPADVKGKIVVASETLIVPNSMMNGHLHGSEWLDIKINPEISFEIKSVKNVKKDGNTGTADVTGTFTLKGVSKEITVPVKVSYLPGKLGDRSPGKTGDLLVVRTNFKINRSDFGIQPGKNTDKVSEEIDLSLAIAGACEK